MHKRLISRLMALMLMVALMLPSTKVYADETENILIGVVTETEIDIICRDIGKLGVNIIGPDSSIHKYTDLRTDRNNIGTYETYTKHTLKFFEPGSWIINIKKQSTPVAIILKTDIGSEPKEIYYSTFEGTELSDLIMYGITPGMNQPIEFIPIDKNTDEVEDPNAAMRQLILFGVVFGIVIISICVFFKIANGKTKKQMANTKQVIERQQRLAEIRKKENAELDSMLEAYESEYTEYAPEVDYSNWTPEHAGDPAYESYPTPEQHIRTTQPKEEITKETVRPTPVPKNSLGAVQNVTPKVVVSTTDDEEYLF